MKNINVLMVCIMLLSGCATLTPEAAGVMVHAQVSNLLDDCKRLGNISKNVNMFKFSRATATQQARNDVRDEAYKRYRADTVAIINTDDFTNSVTVQAIAFKCN